MWACERSHATHGRARRTGHTNCSAPHPVHFRALAETLLPRGRRRRSERVCAHVLQVVEPALQPVLVCRLEVDLGGAPREGVEGEAQRLGGGEQEDVRPTRLGGVEAGEGDRVAERDGHLQGG